MSEKSAPLNFTQLFNDSYERLMDASQHDFFQAFYLHFVAASPEVAAAFANTDMEKQYDMLHLSLMQMMSFASDRRANSYLEQIATRHANLNINGTLYELWRDSLLKTVREQDPLYDAQVELAWRITLAPGLEFMRAYGLLAS